MNGQVKRAFKYRFYPSEAQAAELSRTFGCVRKVYNLALQARAQAWSLRGERIGYEATSALLIAWKRGSVARIHTRIAARRTDHLHKITTRLVRDDQTLVIEDLAVSNMVGNHHLARAINDAGWRQFRQQLEYKAHWHGRNVIVVDRWFPSSKLCSVCGALAAEMPLRVRSWTCGCGATHDRDVNAARNILAAGLAVTVCGADVRPQRNPPGGQSATKQKTHRREP